MNLPNFSPENCRCTDLLTCDPDALIDLQNIRIDTSRPLPERMESFAKQVGNPYLFRVDGLIIQAVYLPDSKGTLLDAVSSLLHLQDPVGFCCLEV